MVDRFLAILVLVGIPANFLIHALQLTSLEVALSILWATVILAIVVGVTEYVKNPAAYNR